MTTIIALEKPDEVVLAWDAQVTLGYRKLFGGPKAFVNNGIVFAMSGDLLDSTIVQYATLPDPEHAGWDVDRWMSRELLPALQAALNAREATEKQNSKIRVGGHALVVVAGRVYQLSSDLSWLRSADGIYGIGSGSEYALGALHAGSDASKAMEIAGRLDTYTGPTATVTTAQEMLEAVTP